MLSENKYQVQTVFEMHESIARKRALNLLNHRKPEHPPDIYFIRRKPELLDKYLDQSEMDSLVKEAPAKFKLNYNLFKLDPQEKEIIRALQNKKRNFFNTDDPYFKRKIFLKGVDSVYDTDKVLGILSPKDHTAWANQSKE